MHDTIDKELIEQSNLYSNISLYIKNRDAVNFLIVLWNVIQFFDDIYDNDIEHHVIKDRVFGRLFDVLITLNDNQFFVQNRSLLLPSMSVMIFKWHAANKSEELLSHNEQSYMWRAGYYDIVLLVNLLCNGESHTQEHSKSILSIYGESFVEYLKEFNKDA